MSHARLYGRHGLNLGLVALALAACGPVEEEDDGASSESSPLTTVSLPGRIEAESYRAGGEGVGYHDTTAGNTGGALRTDSVDIQKATPSGYNVGWTTAGEWIAYDVSVAQAGTYGFSLHVASHTAGTKTMHVEVDGQRSAAVSFTDATGWQSWIDLSAPDVQLSAGSHVLKVVFDTGDTNLDWIDARSKAAVCGSVDAKLVPTCGAWWGIYANEGTGWLPGLTSRETQVGRKFDIAHTYHSFEQMEKGQVPTDPEIAVLNGGQILLVNMTPKLANGEIMTWKQVAAGNADAAIATTAKRIAGLAPRKVFTVFHTEPDGPGQGNVGGQFGNAADYVAAYKHFRQKMIDGGATNTVWVLNFTGYSENYATMKAMNPGPAYFDWYGYDPYDFHGTKGSFLATVKPTYDWIVANHQADGKPIMLPEYGVSDGTAAYRQTWLANVAVELQQLPQLKALTYFDSTGVNDSHVDRTVGGLAAFTAAGHAAYVNQKRP